MVVVVVTTQIVGSEIFGSFLPFVFLPIISPRGLWAQLRRGFVLMNRHSPEFYQIGLSLAPLVKNKLNSPPQIASKMLAILDSFNVTVHSDNDKSSELLRREERLPFNVVWVQDPIDAGNVNIFKRSRCFQYDIVSFPRKRLLNPRFDLEDFEL